MSQTISHMLIPLLSKHGVHSLSSSVGSVTSTPGCGHPEDEGPPPALRIVHCGQKHVWVISFPEMDTSKAWKSSLWVSETSAVFQMLLTHTLAPSRVAGMPPPSPSEGSLGSNCPQHQGSQPAPLRSNSCPHLSALRFGIKDSAS